MPEREMQEMQKERAPQENEDFDYGKVKQAVNQAYEKTADTLSITYGQAINYGRENPGKLTLIAFGAGIGIGLLLAANLGGERSRKNRTVESVVDALSKIALEFLAGPHGSGGGIGD